MRSAKRNRKKWYDDVMLFDRVQHPDPEMQAFWNRNDKAWAWYMFLLGSNLEAICEFVGGHKEELEQWIRGVCAGKEKVTTHPYPLLDARPRQKWTTRHDKILLRMRKAKLDFNEACRLLEREPKTVKLQWQRLKLLR